VALSRTIGHRITQNPVTVTKPICRSIDLLTLVLSQNRVLLETDANRLDVSTVEILAALLLIHLSFAKFKPLWFKTAKFFYATTPVFNK